MKKNNKGFSLVELIVVIAIMAILAGIAIPTFAVFIGNANKAADESYLNDLEYAISMVLAEQGDSMDGYTLSVSVDSSNQVTYALTTGTGTSTTTYAFTNDQKTSIAAMVETTHSFKSQKGAGTWTKTTEDGEVTWTFAATN